MARTHRWRRLAGKTAAWFFGVLAGLVVAALLCINLPFARRIIAKQVTLALDGAVSGKIVIDRIGSVGLTGAGGVQGRLTDAKGRTLVTASGVSAHLRTFTLVKSLLGKSGLDVRLDSVSIDHLDALLDADEHGDLLVQQALASPPPPPNAPPGKASTLKLAIDEARLRSAWLHGRPSPSFLVDADLQDMRLGVTLASGKTTLDLRRLGVDTRAMPSGANVRGNLTAHVVLPPAPQKLAANAGFDGTVADAATKLSGALRNDVLDAHLAADAPPSSLTRVVPSLALRNPVRLRVDAGGTLPDVHATGSIVTGPSRVVLTADAMVATPLHAHVELAADEVDLAAVLKNGPESELNAHLRANVTVPSGGSPTGNFTLETRPARVAGQRVPAMTAKGKLTGAEGDVALEVDEPGTKTHVTVDLDLRKMEAGYDVSVSIPDITKMQRLPGSSTGSASLRVRGTAYLTTSTFSGDVRAEVANVTTNGVRLRKADLGAVVAGPFSNPDVQSKMVSEGVVAAGRTFDAVAVTARGNRDGISVGADLEGAQGTPSANISTRVTLGERLTLNATEAKIGKGDDRVRARADTVWFAGGIVQAEGVTVDGAGAALSAAARVAPNAMDIRAVSAGIDVGKLARAFGLAKKDVRGKLALDVDLKTRGHTARGKLGIELSDAAYAGVDGLDLRVASSVDGQRFTGTVNAKVDGGHVDVDARDLTLGGSPFSPRAWAHAIGRVRIDSNVDLGRLAKVLPTSMLPFDDMGGKVALSGELTRDAADASPETRWQLHTDGFRASAKTGGEPPHDGTKVRAPPPWHVAGVDVDGTFAIAKEAGRTALDAHFRDAVGPLADVDATADLPYSELVSSGTLSAKTLESAPLHFRFSVPRRRLSKLPPILATAGLDGDIELTLEARDTAREPIVKVDAALYQLRARGRRKATPVDVRIDGNYGDGLGKLTFDVNTKAKKALTLDSEVHAKISDLLDGTSGDWDAAVKGKLDEFPLDVLSLVGSRRLKGTVSGELDAATGTHVKPHARAKLSAEGVALGRDRTGGARVTLDANADDHGMDAKVRFDQPDGFAEATASAGLTWSGPLAPKVDPAKGAAKAAASAKHFRLAVLQPLVQGILADLDGRLDANARFEAAAAHGAPKLDGQVVLDQGTFELTSAGQEFHDVHADVVLQPDGTLRASNVSAHGLTGTVKANGEATLDGLSLKRAKLSAKVPMSDPFPVSLQGQSFAKAYGDFELQVVPKPEKEELDVTVNVPSAKITLFDKSTHELQPLDKDEHIRIGYHRTSDEFVVVPLERPARLANTDEPTTTVVATVNLHDVEVVRGTDLRARLEGQPRIRLAKETSLSGEIHLRSGYLYVQGKKFEIESGTITFIGEPDNPNVVVTAGWTAPEGTRVYADFVGPLKTGKVNLRSEPAHSKSEILSLILFGTTDGMGASSNSSSPATTAASVAGGVATQGLNKALDDMTGLDITTRINTSDSANPRPEIEVRVARDVTVAISHVIGVPPPGTNPDLNYATVDWRFLRNWSLDTTMGDLGSSMLDLVWTYRY